MRGRANSQAVVLSMPFASNSTAMYTAVCFACSKAAH